MREEVSGGRGSDDVLLRFQRCRRSRRQELLQRPRRCENKDICMLSKWKPHYRQCSRSLLPKEWESWLNRDSAAESSPLLYYDFSNLSSTCCDIPWCSSKIHSVYTNPRAIMVNKRNTIPRQVTPKVRLSVPILTDKGSWKRLIWFTRRPRKPIFPITEPQTQEHGEQMQITNITI